MFNANELLALLNARPFLPFRFVMRDGTEVEVNSRRLVMPGRQFALIGLPDPAAPDDLVDWYITVWYGLVARVDQMQPDAPLFVRSPDITS